MPLVWEPDAFTVARRNLEVTANVTGSVQYSLPVALSGQVQPKPEGVVYDDSGVEVQSPHVILAGLEHESHFNIGAKVVWRGKNLYVKSIQVFQSLVGVDHLRVVAGDGAK